MARTNRRTAGASTSERKGDSSAARRSQMSHALSKLLRHQAENEKIPISPAGWVRLDHLLAWKGLSRIGQGITVSEIFEVVEEDGRTGKGRFGVMVVERTSDEVKGSVEVGEPATEGLVKDPVGLLASSPSSQPATLQSGIGTSTQQSIDPSSKNTPETQLALLHHKENPDQPPSIYLIRATQGHSMSLVQSADLLSPITLSDQSTIPDTVVHGTFYGAWPLILASGGLKSMGRNNIHFATGPSLEDVLAIAASGDEDTNPVNSGMKTKSQVESVLSKNKVISGMRWDAQLLIYIDIKRCLEDVNSNNLDMKWWKSGNGVVLTEGVAVTDHDSTHNDSGTNLNEPPIIPSQHAKQQRAAEVTAHQSNTDTTPDLAAGVPIIASKHAKAQRAQEILSQQSPSHISESPQPPIQPTEIVPIIASKHAKAQYAAAQQQQTPTQPPPPSPPPILASAHAKQQYANQTPSTVPDSTPNPDVPLIPSQHAKQQFVRQQQQQQQQSLTKLVPMKYVSAVVEIKNGLGVIWRQGEGTVKELPARLRSIPVPRGKGRIHGAGFRGQQGGGGDGGRGKGKEKARLNVERDQNANVEDQDLEVDVDEGVDEDKGT